MAESWLQAAGAYGLFVLIGLVGPGVGIQRLLRLSPDLTLVLPLGWSWVALGYWVALASGSDWILPVGSIFLGIFAVIGWREWRFADGPSLRGAALPAMALVAFVAAGEFQQNRIASDGSFAADGLLADDAAFHAGLTFELAHTGNPQVPGLAGVPLSYHLGQPLVRAAALRWAGIHPYDSLSRFDNTLGAIALVIAFRGLTAAIGGSAGAIALVGWLLLGSDLSFLFAWGRGIDLWVSLFEGSAGLVSILHSNSLIPALAMVAACVVALGRHLNREGSEWLALAAGVAVAAAFFKVFLAAQLLAAIAFAVLMTRQRRSLLVVAGVLALVITMLSAGAGAQTMEVAIDPLLVVADTRDDLGLDVGPVWLLTPVWLIAALGLRLFGVWPALRALLGRSSPAAIVAGLALSGWLIGLLFRVSPLESGNRARPFNEALYFFEQSGFLMWVFVATGLARLRLSGWRRGIGIAVAASLALPSTIQLVAAKRRTPPLVIPKQAVDAMAALAEATTPGDVVLQRPDLQKFPPPPMVLHGRRVPYTRFIGFYAQFVPRPERQRRFRQVMQFFETSDPAAARLIARSLGAGYVCLYGHQSVAFPVEALLEPIFEAPRARVYRIK